MLRKRWRVSATLTFDFDIRYSTGIFEKSNSDLAKQHGTGRCLVVFEKTVFELYGQEARAYFDHHGLSACFCVVDADESAKVIATADKILEEIEKFGLLRRAEPLVAVGGGVLLDIVGFAASIYRRGVPYIRIPTTLLAIVDASVGAKTGVNHFGRRNRLGSYYPPTVSFLDKRFIRSQSQRDIANGLAEIFKLAIIKDSELFNLLEHNAENLIQEKFQFGAVPVRVINRAIEGMVSELAPNLWERNLERCVDFGHSFSPLIEMTALPELSHGEAVCVDCIFSAFIAYGRQLITKDELDRIVQTARRLLLPVYHELFGDSSMVVNALSDTMKHRNGQQNLPLPFGIGSHVFCNDLSEEEVEQSCDAFRMHLG